MCPVPKVVDEGTRKRMKEILHRIQTGEYAKGVRAGEPRRRADAALPPAHDRRAADREGRRPPARDDAVDQEEQARRQRRRIEKLSAPRSLPGKGGSSWAFLFFASAMVSFFFGWWVVASCGSPRCSSCSSSATRAARSPTTRSRWCRRPTGASSGVGKAEDPYLKRQALKVSVFMNIFNVHSNRSPVDGTVKEKWYFPRAPSSTPRSTRPRSRTSVPRCGLRTREGEDVTLRAGGRPHRAAHSLLRRQRRDHARARPALSASSASARASTSYLPLDAEVKAAIGEKV